MIEEFEASTPDGLLVQKLEKLVRIAIFKPAAVLVEFLLQEAADRVDEAYQPKPGEQYKGRGAIEGQSLFGSLKLARDYYYHAGKQTGHYPADAALGMEEGCTPALARLICLEGADATSYHKAEQHLLETGGVAVSARQVHRVVQRVGAGAQAWQQREYQAGQEQRCDAPIMYVSGDATGVPMRAEELAGRQGKQPDGTAKTRQAYLGCVFTQHGRDEKGRPLRDHDSTTYVSSFGTINEFGPMLRWEALRRGMGEAIELVMLIDGAAGLAGMGKDQFQTALQIVDFYHAMEHGARVLEALLGSKDHPDYKARHRQWAKRLLKNGVACLIEEVRQECAGRAMAEAVEKELTYFVTNIKRMQYGTFRKKGYFIGSGVIEAGCKTVIGTRCKQSGMFWGEPGAEHILALRCIHASRRLDEYWQHRLRQRADQNAPMLLAA